MCPQRLPLWTLVIVDCDYFVVAFFRFFFPALLQEEKYTLKPALSMCPFTASTLLSIWANLNLLSLSLKLRLTSVFTAIRQADRTKPDSSETNTAEIELCYQQFIKHFFLFLTIELLEMHRGSSDSKGTNKFSCFCFCF